MTDPPRPRRPEGFPPPLPGAHREPFPKAKSEPPQPLDVTPAPDARRTHSTPPSGSLMLSHLVEQLEQDPRDALIKDLQQTVRLYREKLTESQQVSLAPSPVPAPPKSRAVVAGKVSLNIGKYTALVSGVLALADVVVSLWFPEYVGPLGMVKRVLGAP